MGSYGRDVPHETQFMLVESHALGAGGECAVYTILLPLVDGSFRASLQGSESNELQLCVESGNQFLGQSILDLAFSLLAVQCNSVSSHVRSYQVIRRFNHAKACMHCFSLLEQIRSKSSQWQCG